MLSELKKHSIRPRLHSKHALSPEKTLPSVGGCVIAIFTIDFWKNLDELPYFFLPR
jgi:hypothetical protein